MIRSIHQLFLTYTKSADLRSLFEHVAIRDEAYVRLSNQVIEQVLKRRSLRERRKVELGARREATLRNLDNGAEAELLRLEAYFRDHPPSEADMLNGLRDSARQELESDEMMVASCHPDDKDLFRSLAEWRRETLRILQDFCG